MNADAHTSGDDGEQRGNRPPLHLPVLLQSVLSILELRSGLVVVDGTVGAGGHAVEMSLAIGPDGVVVGLDRDREILVAAQEALADAKEACAGAGFSLHHSAHARMREVLLGAGQPQCDRVLLDLGVSSLQLDHPERGFSFMADGPLDMRMDADAPLTAAQWLARVSEVDLANTLFQLGEERFSRRIARRLSRSAIARQSCAPVSYPSWWCPLCLAIRGMVVFMRRRAPSKQCAWPSMTRWVSLSVACRQRSTAFHLAVVWP